MSRPDGGAEFLERRLALVMNGGVSLAVWMGGVACEVDNLRRASSGLPAAVPADLEAGRAEAERELFGLWQQHTAPPGGPAQRVKVDVIAGTSAGGLNGVILAMAIARGAPVGGLRKLWMEAAQLSAAALLSPQDGGSASVLNGTFFLKEVHKVLGSLETSGASDDGRDVALTVTATSLRGESRPVADSTGTQFYEPDHRRRFEFRRAARQLGYLPKVTGADQFPPQARDDFCDPPTLARAARASASYPVAFEPVEETGELRGRRTWPDWPTSADRDWLADGGILDNSPFEPVLQAIADQPVDTRWHRTLCFVVPSADETDLGREIVPPGDQGLPPPWTSVIAASAGLPREANLRDDIEQLHDLMRTGRSRLDVRRFASFLGPSAGAGAAFTQARSAAEALLGLYRESRAVAGVYEALDALAGADGYLNAQPGIEPEAVLAGPRRWLPDDLPREELPAQWTWGLAAAGRAVTVMLRSLAQDDDAPDALRSHLSRISRQIAAVRSAVMSAFAAAPPREDVPSAGLAAAVADLIDRTFDELGVPAVLAEQVNEAARAFAAAKLRDQSQAVKVLQAALCLEVINGAGGVPAQTKAAPIFDFIRLGPSKAPDSLRAGIEAALAAASAAAGRPATMSDILYGTRLSHFAAFGRADWRAWDWMWGRIHAAVHLGTLLGLSETDINELTGHIITAEGRTIADVSDQISDVITATSARLIADLEADGLLPLTTDAVLSLLGSSRQTFPEVPRAMRTIGGWANALGAHHPTGLSPLRRAARIAAWPFRAYAWRKLARRLRQGR
jgi:predicted acylesterase/phospholipase RssA